MYLKNVRLSSRTSNLMGLLKMSTGLESATLARLALCLSLRQRGVPNPDEYNQMGGDISPASVFGDRGMEYMALLTRRLNSDGLDPELYMAEMLRAHINRGMIGLKQRVRNLSDFSEMVREVHV